MVTSSIFSRNAVRALTAAGAVTVLAWASLSFGNGVPASSVAAGAPVALKAELHPRVVRPGRTVRAAVKVHVATGFHIQAHKPNDPSMIATVLTWDAVPWARVGRTLYPAPVKETVDFTDEPLLVYGGTALLRTPVTVRAGTKPGTYTLTGSLRYQACSGSECRAPAKLPVALTVIVKR